MKNLISITSCNRLSDIKKYIWDYLKFVHNNPEFDFVLALDGYNQEYIDFCNTYDIPLIYSDEREGVGISKNRVLSTFKDYDHYFFIDDDVELLNDSVFTDCINLNIKGIQHISPAHFLLRIQDNYLNTKKLYSSYFGGGYFLYYSKKAIEKIGGWHTLFAKYRRFGHTEHSYRTVFNNLQEYPFIFSHTFFKKIMVHSPPSVSKIDQCSINHNELIDEEQALIDQKHKYFPISTLSNFYSNQKNTSRFEKAIAFLESNNKKYPFLNSNERKRAYGEFYALKLYYESNLLKTLWFSLLSFVYYPFNSDLKHFYKIKIFGWKNIR